MDALLAFVSLFNPRCFGQQPLAVVSEAARAGLLLSLYLVFTKGSFLYQRLTVGLKVVAYSVSTKEKIYLQNFISKSVVTLAFCVLISVSCGAQPGGDGQDWRH